MGRYLRNFRGFIHPLCPRAGFTLIELVIGAGILAFALCALVSGLVSLMSLAEIARDKTVAVNDAQQVMEQMQDTSFLNVTRRNWTNWAVNNGCNSLDNEQINAGFTYPAFPATDILQITVTVTWQTKNRPLSVSLATLKTK